MTKKINIVFASDNSYVQHLITAITSLLENTKDKENIIINIIDGGISEENRMFLNNTIKKYGSLLVLKKIDTKLLKNVVINGHITDATYYRILIPSIFGKDIEKIIYLDSDIIVRNDIREFWNIDIEGYSLGAVRIYDYSGHATLKVPSEAKYFNAGILLMNLKVWRERNISQKVLEYIKNYPERLISWDQDALNGVLYDDWKEIDLKWNLRSQLFESDYQNAGLTNEDEFIQLITEPSIIHFTTATKPWHYYNRHPFKEEYFSYLNKSNFKYEKFPEKNIILAKKIILFGSSKKAEKIREKLNQYGLGVSYYVDNDSNKWGKSIGGLTVLKPEDILGNLELDNILVIISSQYVSEIKEQLKKIKLTENKHFVTGVDYLGYLR